MIRRAVAGSLILVSLLLAADPLQASSRIARNLQFSNITATDGLSGEYVFAVVQDSYGYMWFGTQNGLNRFDGHELIVYEHDAKNPRSLSNNFVWSLYVDEDGTLWVSTNNGVNRYNYEEDAFDRNPLNLPSDLRSLRVRTSVKDGNTMWLGTVDAGLFAVDTGSGEIGHYEHDAQRADSLPSNHVIALMRDRRDRLWVGTDGGGLARLDRASNGFHTFRYDADNAASIADDAIRSIYEDRSGNVWVGTAKGGLNLLDDTSGTFRRFIHDAADPNSLGAGQVPAIFEDNKGSLWVGTEEGLSEWRPGVQGFVRYRNNEALPSSLVNDTINAIYQDNSGVLWLATSGGVSSWNYFSDTFAHYQVAQDFLADNRVSSIAENSEGVLWVGTYGGGLTRLDLAIGEARHYRHDADAAGTISDDRVMAVQVDAQDRVWVGTRYHGLNMLGKDGRFRTFRHNPEDPDSLSGDAITSIHVDDDGGVWVGVFDGGLNYLADVESGLFFHYRKDPDDSRSLSSDRVLTLHGDDDGRLWIGTEAGGLNVLVDREAGTFKHYPLTDDVNNHDADKGTAWDLSESSDGTFWISTMNEGLVRWNANARANGQLELQRYGTAQGLASTVYGAVPGAMGEIWASTSRGLYRFDPESQNVAHFDVENGLQTSDFNQGAALRSRSGRLLFGSNKGVVGFFPAEIPRNGRAPQVHASARSRDALLSKAANDGVTPRVELAYLDPFIAFDFVALDFVSADKNQFRYRLRGFDEAWVEETRFRRAVYSNLPSGDYVFEVLGANNDGVWSEEPASIAVTVIPPPWRQWWAYMAYAFIGMSLLLWYLRAQRVAHRREAEQRAKLEQEVRERTSELAARYAQLERLNERLAEASVTDSLTGLRNRRYVDQFIGAETAMVRRRLIEGDTAEINNVEAQDSSKLLFFMMIDLDGFKYINDTFGHQAGDNVLVQVKERLETCCRESDVIVRWGGDEFMIIGHASSFNGVKVLAERIRESLAAIAYDVGLPDEEGRVSGSIGVSPFPMGQSRLASVRWEQVAAIADKAAYIAKANGRNAWVSIDGSDTLEVSDFSSMTQDFGTLIESGKLIVDSSIPGQLKLDWEDDRVAATGR